MKVALGKMAQLLGRPGTLKADSMARGVKKGPPSTLPAALQHRSCEAAGKAIQGYNRD